ncbi:MAG: ATP-binding protein [Methanoregula sp.]|nr:ATP-binding protein [Methanoregula sp.]
MDILQSGNDHASTELILHVIIVCAIILGLWVVSTMNYLLFHSLVELASIIVCFTIFVIVWNTRDKIDNGYFIVVGLAFFFIGAIDLFHTLAYKGMGVFLETAGGLQTQLWIAARYLQAFTLLAAPFFIRRKVRTAPLLVIYSAATALLLWMIFAGMFPACFIEGQGLTPFKITSEYIISILLIAATVLLYWKRAAFNPRVFHYLVAFNLLTICAELSFTSYSNLYGFMNTIGHFFRFAAVYCLYIAIVTVALRNPFDLLYSELKEKSVALEQSVEQLKELDRLKSMFIATMSHELRTPLNSIIGFTGIMVKGMAGPINPEQKKQLGMVQESARHLLALINDVIDISKIEAGKIEASISTFDLADVIRDVQNTFAPQAADQGLAVNIQIPESISVTSDDRRIRQIIMNLVSNAIKFTDTGSVSLTVQKKGAVIEVRVSDTGIGITGEDLKKLFRPFVRVQVPGRLTEGTGLGLYLSQKLARFLGGEITAESEPGKGSVFTFSFPAVYAKQEENRQ